ncbi:MAG TPA: PAS domain-containing protein [Gaiellaceae bacterium]
MEDSTKDLLGAGEVQATLLADAVQGAEVGFLVWEDDRHYIAANQRACSLLGCTLEQLLGSTVGDRTVGGDEIVSDVVRGHGGRGRVTVERWDGEAIELEYLTFATRTAGLPYMASVIWEADA